MHGSFTRDFVYRCHEDFISHDYYDQQTELINTLAKYDQWQKGTYVLSNGHKQMARILFGVQHKVNALTHETPRRVSDGRTEDVLRSQGAAIVQATLDQFRLTTLRRLLSTR
mgnify:CR=1 FL=1